ncbi:ShlB/FhaC/HecB family hemolysin secretion/activation protein [Pikeienuella piscinae]|uniref:ShlB/FhaC/HecB family hemolysin secretion/activation protein n=1 Tax=Pikeienuella piscinae TaxID=2748098 RepID=A0A7L5BSF0_9RHOB|nr:ShlB/FhaC/HecB family hemolysin secretion/activation protein [Pikeienuella piscinae]QIE54060.1 ShlB/FhaC/HecB family hemolysin secretion/activation protein [Pikeienuella piscinae]
MLGVALWAGFAHPAFAQTAVQEIMARRNADRRDEPSPLTEPRVKFTSQRAPSNAEDILFVLNAVELHGATAFDFDALAALYGEEIGRRVTLTQVFEIAARIQDLYRESGFIFTRVLVPAQAIEGGAVRLEIIEARIDGVQIEEPEGPVGPARKLVERMIAPLVGVLNPTDALLERTILNVNELPGVTRATVVPQPSGPESRGGLVLHVNVERDPFEGVFYADNRQSPAIGRGVIGGTIGFNSYSEWADTTSISIFNSFDVLSDKIPETGETDAGGDFDERTTVLVAHQRAVGTDGLTLQATALYSRTRPGDEIKKIGIQGRQVQATIGLTYPLVRSRAFELNGGLGLEYLDSQTDISNGVFRVSDDRQRVGVARIDGVYRDPLGYTTFAASLRQGFDVLNATAPDDLERSRFDGRSVFTLARAEAERLLIVNDDLNAYFQIGGQYSLTPLLAAEEFAIGGITFGRGYDPSEFTGDNGVGVTGELRYVSDLNLYDVAFTMETYGFGDYGVVWNLGNGEPRMQRLISAGGGVRLYLPEQVFVEAELAFPANQPLTRVGPDGEQITGPRFFLTLSKRF